MDFDEKEMSMGGRGGGRRERKIDTVDVDKRWKCRDKIDPPPGSGCERERERKKNGWDRNFESREDVYK